LFHELPLYCYRHAAALSKVERDRLRLYFVIGEDDFPFPRQGPFLNHLKELGIRYTFVLHSKVGHNLGVLTQLSGEAMVRELSRQLREVATAGGGP
jgi:hypothetical protein